MLYWGSSLPGSLATSTWLLATPCGSQQYQSTMQPGSCSGVKIMKRAWLGWKDWRCLNTSVSPYFLFSRLKFWYLGEAGPQLILMIIFIKNNGGPTEHMFSVISGENNILTEISFKKVELFSFLLCWESSLRNILLWHGLLWKGGKIWANDDELIYFTELQFTYNIICL